MTPATITLLDPVEAALIDAVNAISDLIEQLDDPSEDITALEVTIERGLRETQRLRDLMIRELEDR